MKCLIIDDDPISCRILREYIEKTEGLELSGTYLSAVDAINNSKSFIDIGIIFLDVEMPDMTGFDFISNLDAPPQIIMVSSKENYAVDAFTVSVVDFLLKPITYARFLKSIKKIKPQAEPHKVEIDSVKFDGMFLKRGNSFFRVKFSDIMSIEAFENYVYIHTIHEKFLLHQTLKTIISKLPLGKFVKIHRSHVVNIDYISSVDDSTLSISKGNGMIKLPIGKTYKGDLFQTLNTLY
jgi:DNA-binding LytR/AlgR family response regulator